MRVHYEDIMVRESGSPEWRPYNIEVWRTFIAMGMHGKTGFHYGKVPGACKDTWHFSSRRIKR